MVKQSRSIQTTLIRLSLTVAAGITVVILILDIFGIEIIGKLFGDINITCSNVILYLVGLSVFAFLDTILFKWLVNLPAINRSGSFVVWLTLQWLFIIIPTIFILPLGVLTFLLTCVFK